MQNRYYHLAETIFCLKSELEMEESEELALFRIVSTQTGRGQSIRPSAVYTVYVKYAGESEETPDSHGYAKVERSGNEIRLSVNKKKLQKLSDWQIFVMLPTVRLLLEQRTLVLHSSFLIYEGKALLFSGRSGIGKSTQAELWEKYRDGEIINGDRSLIYYKNGKVYAGGYFHCGTSGIMHNKSAEIAAIVLLEQSKANEVSVPRGLEAFKNILSQCAYDVEDREEIAMATELVAELIKNVRIFQYKCRKDMSAVEELEKYL